MDNARATDMTEQSPTQPRRGQMDADDSSPENDADVSGRWGRWRSTRAERKAQHRADRAALMQTVQLSSLRSLSPQYEAEHHAGYLNLLEAATREPRNLNIALTGRYGAGKSSVLDKFQARRSDRTQRLAISTLAPGAPGDSTTNRIQKEIVKQLVYGASEKVGKSSRFNRIAVTSKPKAAAQMVPFVVGVGALLFLFGWRPDLSWGGSDDPTWKKLLAWGAIATVALGAATFLRLGLRGRSLADVKAAGAGVALTKDSETYFDEYLDEIVHYFDRESKDVVILEDLDRFDDPNILEALRELNLLLNETPKRRKRRRGNPAGRALTWVLSRRSGRAAVWFGVRADAFLPPRWADRVQGRGVPLRFVYALKDSLFEKVAGSAKHLKSASRDGVELDLEGLASTDPDLADTLRTNRTKFFDVVVPIVPFISHRNARELLQGLLQESGIIGLDRRLVGLVARRTHDMRLMRNMCNEYSVFAERLLPPDTSPPQPGQREDEDTRNPLAPRLEANRLFALIAYKNFHPGDFENIARNSSTLDNLYELHQKMVRATIVNSEKFKREEQAAPAARERRLLITATLSARLLARAGLDLRIAQQSNNYYYGPPTHTQFLVGGTVFDHNATLTSEFWVAVAKGKGLTVQGVLPNQNGTNELVSLGSDELLYWFPELHDVDRWNRLDASATKRTLISADADIEFMRKADFADLAASPRFKLAEKQLSGDDISGQSRTFAEMVEQELMSELARDLVKAGYIDRNFSLYAAQFYGHFTGPDVATFVIQHLQTNTMAIDYDLRRDGAVANLLTEARDLGEDLVHSRAVLNIDIVNYLLRSGHNDGRTVVTRLADEESAEVVEFRDAFFTSSMAEREMLLSHLAKWPWRNMFGYLITSDAVPDDDRASFVSAALLGAEGMHEDDFALGQTIGMFLLAHYTEMTAFTGKLSNSGDAQDQVLAPVSASQAETIAQILARVDAHIPHLSVLDNNVCAAVIKRNLYGLTADNLRTILGVTGGVPLDRVHRNPQAEARCLESPQDYLAAISTDTSTPHAIESFASLTQVLTYVDENWSEDQFVNVLPALLLSAAGSATLPDLTSVPDTTWPALAQAKLFRSSVNNIEAYRRECTNNEIDDSLASLIETEGSIDSTGDVQDTYSSEDLALAVINAASSFSSPTIRAALAADLGLSEHLRPETLPQERTLLLTELLKHHLVSDDAATFEHFHSAGWAAIGPAIRVSKNFAGFVEPGLLQGMVGDLFGDCHSPQEVRIEVAKNLESYVPETGDANSVNALQAGAEFANASGLSLTPGLVTRVAREGGKADLAISLLANASPKATQEDVIAVFTSLGDPFARISQSGAQFFVASSDAIHALLPLLGNGVRTRRNARKGTTRVSVQ